MADLSLKTKIPKDEPDTYPDRNAPNDLRLTRDSLKQIRPSFRLLASDALSRENRPKPARALPRFSAQPSYGKSAVLSPYCVEL